MEINLDELAIIKNLMPAAANDCNVFVTCLFINYGYLDGQSVWLQSEQVGQNNCLEIGCLPSGNLCNHITIESGHPEVVGIAHSNLWVMFVDTTTWNFS